MRILYVEDNHNEALLVSRYLQTTAHDVVLAANTEEAEAAMDIQPDIVLVDIVLGESRGGFHFVRDLRAQGYTQPIIAVTGLSTPKDLAECRSSGVDYILNKPFAITQLADIIHQYS